MTVELMNKKLSVSISTIVGIVTAVASVVGVYWKMHTELELQGERIKSLTERVKELDVAMKSVENTLWDVSVLHNDMVRGIQSTSTFRKRRSVNEGVVRRADTVDLVKLKIRRGFRD